MLLQYNQGADLSLFCSFRPYRRQGLASKLISHVIEAATASHDKASDGNGTTASANKADTPSADKKQKKATDDKKADEAKDKKTEQANAGPSPVIESMYLHVQTSNDEARRFWESHGFEVKVRERGGSTFLTREGKRPDHS